jgi:antitoxin component of MazEF toxin-antitoxin module
MPQLTIVSHGDSAAVILPAAVLESAGLHVGNVVDVTLGDGQLARRRAPFNLTKISEIAAPTRLFPSTNGWFGVK